MSPVRNARLSRSMPGPSFAPSLDFPEIAGTRNGTRHGRPALASNSRASPVGPEMANNRLFIVDTETGEEKLLCKTFGSGWYEWQEPGVLTEWLEERDIAASYGNGDSPTKLRLRAENDTDYQPEYSI